MEVRGVPALVGLAAAVAALALLACGNGETPTPTPPSPPPVRPAVVTFTHVMVGYAPALATAKRSKAEARDLAHSILARIRGGERMEPLVLQFSDDREPGEEPFNGGSYTKRPEDITVPELRRVVFSLAVGQLADEPVDSGYAYHVVRRDH
jgi:hypothetical protein